MAIPEKTIITVLEKNGGWITPAAKALGITRQALHQRITKNPKLKLALAQIRESHLDLAESKVIKAMQDGKPWAICFFLKCQGKGRGWIETHRAEITGADGGPIETQETKPDYSKLTKDELKQLHELSEKLYAKD